MADLVTRLRLESREFDDNIRRSRRQIEGIQESGDIAQRGLDSLLTKFKGFALGMAATSTVFAAFDKAINSNSILQDKWKDNIGGMKRGVDDFFTSLASGDWSIFEGGMDRAIKKGKIFEQMSRNLTLGLKMTTAFMDDADARMDDEEGIINSPFATKIEKENAYQAAKDKYTHNEQVFKELREGFDTQLKRLLKSGNIDISKIQDPTLLRNILLEKANPLNLAASKNIDRYVELWNKQNKAFSRDKLRDLQAHRFGDSYYSGDKRVKEYKDKIQSSDWYKEYKKLLDEQPELEVLRQFRLWTNEGDDFKNKMNLIDLLGEEAGLRSRQKSYKDQWSGIAKDFDKRGNYIGDLSPEGKKQNQQKEQREKIYALNTIKGLEQEIARLEDIISKTPMDNPELINPLQAQLETAKLALNTFKATLQKPIPENSLAYIRNEIARVTEELEHTDVSLDPEKFDEMVNELHKLEKEEIEINAKIHPVIDGNETQEQADEQDTTIDLKFEGIQDAISGFGQLADSIANFQGTSEGLQKGMVVMSTTAAIAGMIAGLVTKASTTSLTVWDYIAGLLSGTAAIVSMASQLRSISAYAGGGLVDSPLTTGDRNIIRVNGGEMVLNRGQQYNLFKLLDNGANSVTSRGRVEFKIQGRELVGVLNNYNNRNNKLS